MLLCLLSCVQALGDEEKSVSCSLHEQEVKVICHDALQMAQLQQQIARSYGTVPCKLLRACLPLSRHVIVALILMTSCHRADLVFWDMPYGLGVAPWDVLLTDTELDFFFPTAGCDEPCAHALSGPRLRVA